MRAAFKVAAIVPLASVLVVGVALMIPLYAVSAVLARVVGVSWRAM